MQYIECVHVFLINSYYLQYDYEDKLIVKQII